MLPTVGQDAYLETHAMDLVRQVFHSVRELFRVRNWGVRSVRTRRCMPAWAADQDVETGCHREVGSQSSMMMSKHKDNERPAVFGQIATLTLVAVTREVVLYERLCGAQNRILGNGTAEMVPCIPTHSTKHDERRAVEPGMANK
jgi:hypothetical protein